MSKHSERRQRARLIRAAAKPADIIAEAITVEWINAAEADAEKPKRFSMTSYTGGPM